LVFSGVVLASAPAKDLEELLAGGVEFLVAEEGPHFGEEGGRIGAGSLL
jgi:hypothetical protein